MERTLMDRGAQRAAAKEAFRTLRRDRGFLGSFNDFWRERNDDDHASRAAHQQKNSLKRHTGRMMDKIKGWAS
jgi:hypothetical protein